jgi:hypothetical protein
LGQVLETCCHLMLNHSWDVHIWYNMRNLKKNWFPDVCSLLWI